MKLITLNTWCGILYEPLIKFVGKYSNDTDIFCFQEMRNGKYSGEGEGDIEELYKTIQNILPNHKGYYSEMAPGIGIAIFLKNSFEIGKFESKNILSSEEVKDVKISNGQKPHPRIIQMLTLKNGLSILNFHGVPGDLKKDSELRELQTNRLLSVLNSLNGPKILVGDFNLNPDTLAIHEIEKQMRNLMKESEFKTTRSSHYEKKEIMPFADYIFVSPELSIKDFKVLSDEVSDHLPLYLDFQ